MLKALELIGFKSFANKTRFEFPPGITVVVGPNGSGKSNIVDAIKWVLGEQSAKSLRGKEMADVIFNGSSSRRAINSAEVTLTLDNSKKILAVETPEVHITRRVYRSGEGEYLINHQPCRLRDIKELFSGTGIATEAYSVIEQGKVDILLQSSPKDRRVIFEEAAGISRFKAKKIESQRRLDRVEQNLLRLSDIVDEVGNQLRMVRMQASKARRYREYSDRLQELRTAVGLADWRVFTEKIETLDHEIQNYRDEIEDHDNQLQTVETEIQRLETIISSEDQTIRRSESQITENRERIATLESTLDHQRVRQVDYSGEVNRYRKQLHILSTKGGHLDDQLQELQNQVDQSDSTRREQQITLVQHQENLADTSDILSHLRQEYEARAIAFKKQVHQTAILESEISLLNAQNHSAQNTQQECDSQLAELTKSKTSIDNDREKLNSIITELEERQHETEINLNTNREQLAANRRKLTQLQKELTQQQGRYTGAKQRSAVIEDLEKRQDGLNSGVKEVLAKARIATHGPLSQIHGLVADLIHVNVETASLIEVALGSQTQYLVVSSNDEFFQWLQQYSSKFTARVGFLSIETLGQPSATTISFEGRAGVMGRADRFVQTEPAYKPLVEKLLDRTWIVETLSHAIALAKESAMGMQFITAAGELVNSQGIILLGPRQMTTGLISRRSELRALQDQFQQLENEITQSEADIVDLEKEILQQEEHLEDEDRQHRKLQQELSDQRHQSESLETELAHLTQQIPKIENQYEAAKLESEETKTRTEKARQELQVVQADLALTESSIELEKQQIVQLESKREQQSQETTDIQVLLAKTEQLLHSLQTQLQQLQQHRQERDRAVTETRIQLTKSSDKLQQTGQVTLSCTSQLAELYLCKEQLGKDSLLFLQQREYIRNQRTEQNKVAQQIRRKISKIEKTVHQVDLSAGEFRHERTTLADRLREDYEIEIAEIETDVTDEEQQARDQVEQEIANLRRKINNIGGVNVDALEELDELESRYQSLSTQHQDLSNAKSSLLQIIERINVDSRRLFTETLETVTGHFQQLFRKLFGGGQADIIIDDADDILESGVEIVARPPGKEPRNISLLSGGEKTLTCVALLLAIFRSRPSPFCVLDEVDAALDEANIGRFVGVLNEFLVLTQFIVVTHSKKTMTCANTLYGVTMQESGISKRVSVRFEDVSEDGHIHQDAIDRQQASDSEQDGEADPSDDDSQAA